MTISHATPSEARNAAWPVLPGPTGPERIGRESRETPEIDMTTTQPHECLITVWRSTPRLLASELAAWLADCGVTGAAVKTVLAATALERHAHRVAATTAAIAAVAGQCPVRRRALIEMDIWGSADPTRPAQCGGSGGTARLPCFRQLGKGRWHARDGGAWRAALEAAAADLPGIVWDAGPFDGRLMAGVPTGYWAPPQPEGSSQSQVWEPTTEWIEIGPGLAPAPWRLAVARYGLLRSLGLCGEPRPDAPRVEEDTVPLAWGGTVNAIMEECVV